MKKEKIIVGIILMVCLISLGMGIYLIMEFPKMERKMEVPKILQKEGIAVIHIYGPIRIGSQMSPWDFYPQGADMIVQRLKEVREDTRVKAIVLRINSPGGSVGATQEIYAEVNKIRESGKKVIVSMGDVATSGAYYIACAADKIVANPGTLTGSIGVIMELGNIEELFKKIGVKIEVIKSGKHKDIGSPTRSLTPKERSLLQEVINNAYEQFLKAVMKGREMKREKVMELGQGQIFTGEQAMSCGLIDQIGNYGDTLKLAAELAEIKGEPVIIKKYQPLQKIIDIFSSKFNHPLKELLPDKKVRFEYIWEG